MLKRIRHELNYLTKDDFTSALTFVIAIIPALIVKTYYKVVNKKVWLISEDRNEARDNGACFFKYLCDKNNNGFLNDNLNVYYAISYNSSDYPRIAEIGRTVRFGSVKHWILYIASELNISTQKAGSPGAAVGYVLEHLGIIRNKSIFLQHGITLSKAKWLFYENTKMRLFICGAKPEYEYVKEEFGYPPDRVAYLGFCRFDDYHMRQKPKAQILLIPSWREWIGSKNEFTNVYEDTSVFENTEYYKKYQSLINNKELHSLLKSNDLMLYFYPHRNMQKFIDSFSTECNNIEIVSNTNSDIRRLLMESALMITDYSSVALDFAYMKKPVIYYQFDAERFREAQYKKGYFDYETCGLGSWVDNEKGVIGCISQSIKSGFSVGDSFLNNHKAFFTIYDDANCERTYQTLLEISNE